MRPDAHFGHAFFSAASKVLQTGILLLSDDHRNMSGWGTMHTLHDFGTDCE